MVHSKSQNVFLPEHIPQADFRHKIHERPDCRRDLSLAGKNDAYLHRGRGPFREKSDQTASFDGGGAKIIGNHAQARAIRH